VRSPHEVEARWRARWNADATYEVDTTSPPTGVASPAHFYNLVEFPYPSGEGLHVGHAMTYCGPDVVGRLQRMRGKTVFQPMAFDAFGINAENYALREGVHPATLMERTTA
jgi:leucyl-tRNA synthetase